MTGNSRGLAWRAFRADEFGVIAALELDRPLRTQMSSLTLAERTCSSWRTMRTLARSNPSLAVMALAAMIADNLAGELA